MCDWLVRFTGRRIDGVHVGDGELVRHQQLYRDDFPRVWRDFALSQTAGGDPVGDDDGTLLAGAAAAAARWGLTADTLTAEQKAHWATPDELARWSDERVLEAVLVRSYDDPWMPSRLAAVPGLLDDFATARAVAEAHMVNDQVASWSTGRSIAYLKHDKLARRLAADWGLADADGQRLRAAALDRGFSGFAAAAEATRPFFLRRELLGRTDAA